MDYNLFPRPAADSGAGIHLSPNGSYPLGSNDAEINRFVKFILDGGFSWATAVLTPDYIGYWQERPLRLLQDQGVEVIIRLFEDKPYPRRRSPEDVARLQEAIRFYVQRGFHYFQLGNEPNLKIEWESEDAWNAQGSIEARSRHVAEWAMEDIRMVQALGGIPLTVPLAPGGDDDSERYWKAMCVYWRVAGEGLFNNMAMIAIGAHPYALNHPVWYPYDEVNQTGDNPGQDVMSGAGGSNCWLHYQFLAHTFYNEMGYTPPVISTEDGARYGEQADGRYPRTDESEHRRVHLELADYMTRFAEEGMFCTSFWLIASKFVEAHVPPGRPYPDFEPQAWFTPYWQQIPGRTGEEFPTVQAFRQRGFRPRARGIPWRHETVGGQVVHIVFPVLALNRQSVYYGQLQPDGSRAWMQRPETTLKSIVIHHTAGNPMATPFAIHELHKGAPRHYPGIAYHWYIDGAGQIWQTNDDTIYTFHANACNAAGIGVCFGGTFMAGKKPNAVQMEAGRYVIQMLQGMYNIPDQNVVGHKMCVGASTECPGDTLWYKELLPGGSVPPPPPHEDLFKLLRRIAWEHRKDLSQMNWNEDSAFYKKANLEALGAPETPEFDFWTDIGQDSEQEWRAQGYSLGIVYTEIYRHPDGRVDGNWEDVKVHMRW